MKTPMASMIFIPNRNGSRLTILCEKIDEDTDLGREAPIRGAHRGDGQGARLVLAQDALQRAGVEVPRAEPIRHLRDAEARQHGRSNLLAAVRSKATFGNYGERSALPLEAP